MCWDFHFHKFCQGKTFRHEYSSSAWRHLTKTVIVRYHNYIILERAFHHNVMFLNFWSTSYLPLPKNYLYDCNMWFLPRHLVKEFINEHQKKHTHTPLFNMVATDLQNIPVSQFFLFPSAIKITRFKPSDVNFILTLWRPSIASKVIKLNNQMIIK